MRILFLTTQLPYPPVSGGVIKTWRLVSHLARKEEHDFQLIFPLKNDDKKHLPAFRQKLPKAEVFAVPLSRGRSAVNLLKSYLAAPTLNVYRNADVRLADKAREWGRHADLIFVDHYEMGQYLPREKRCKVILHQHNAEYVMWERLADFELNPIKRMLIKLEASRIKKTELKYAEKSDLVLAAPNDIAALIGIGVDSDKCETTFHLGEDFMLDLPALSFEGSEKALLFVGTLTWEANVDGLLWFLDAVWPLVLKKHPRLRFYIVGKNPDPRLKKATDGVKNIELTGFVEDLEPYHNLARVFVIPLRFGSGIKVKLLNALYRGLPVVTTEIGTEGIEVANETDLYSTSVPEKQAEYIDILLTQKAKWNAMSKAARELSKKYTWEALLEKHDGEISALMNR